MAMSPLQVERKIQWLEKQIGSIEKEDPFLNPKQVSQLLGISLSSAYNLFKVFDFPGKKIAGSYRVRRSQLYRYFDNLPKD